MDLAREYPFTMAANFHTGSEVVNYPWDTYQQLHPDDDWWRLVCHEYADHVHLQDTMYMTAYDNGIVNGYVWYTIWGSRQDYMNYYAQCREVTIECSNAYTPDPSLMPMYWTYNHESIIRYMEQCLNGIHGMVTDSLTGEPLEAVVFIDGHDHHGSSVSSHLPAGDYHRPIKGGTYEVTYSSRGYYSQTHTITVADREAVVKDVQLAPINTGLEEFRVFDVYPNPTSGLLFVKASGITEYRITNLLGQTLLTGVLNGETIDISVLSNGFYLLKIKNSIIKVIVNQ